MLKKINEHFYLDLDDISLFAQFGNDIFYTLKLKNTDTLMKIDPPDALAIEKALDEPEEIKTNMNDFLKYRTAGEIRNDMRNL